MVQAYLTARHMEDPVLDVRIAGTARIWIEERMKRLDSERVVNMNPSVKKAIDDLLDMQGDAVLLLAAELPAELPEGIAVISAMERAGEGAVMISDDFLDYLPHKSLILCEDALVKRQIRRYRADLSIWTATDFAAREGLQGPSEEEDVIDWCLKRKDEGRVHAVVCDRVTFEIVGGSRRRQRLDLPIGKHKDGHFPPAPFSGQVLFVCRKGFPESYIPDWCNGLALEAWKLESILLDGVDKALAQHTSIHAQWVRTGSLLKHSEDPVIKDEYVTPEGDLRRKRRGGRGGLRIRMGIEWIGKGGRRSLAVSRIGPADDARFLARRLVVEWKEAQEVWMNDKNDDDESVGPIIF